MKRTFTAIIEFDPESNTYIGQVPSISGAHSVGDTLDELRLNLQEVLELCLEANGELVNDLPQVIGTQQIEVSV
jgi:predicted RNase H-like HicB family nuclease